MKKKRIVLLGASGSIGMQTLDVIKHHSDEFELVAFSLGHQIDKIDMIMENFPIHAFCVQEEEAAAFYAKKYPECTVFAGDEGLLRLAEGEGYDVLVNALVGFVGFMPTLRAIETKHDVALANKETLVVGGELIQKAVKQHGVALSPIDSEHSAIFQCLQGNDQKQVNRLLITASGGSFRNLTREQLKDVTVEQALSHPNWTMGAKITIDSATMMNKGFEVMEAHYLFDIPYDKIHVYMHDESVVHSMVEYDDYSIIAQLGNPDMRLPIQYALTYPNRYPIGNSKPFDLASIGTLHFKDPDFARYPLLKLAYMVGKRGGTLPAYMNAANEVANAAFRNGLIPFLAIEEIVIATVETLPYHEIDTVDDLLVANQVGFAYAQRLVEEYSA